MFLLRLIKPQKLIIMDVLFIPPMYIALCFLVAAVGSGRKIGGLGAFIVSLIFTPVIGLIITLFADKKEKK